MEPMTQEGLLDLLNLFEGRFRVQAKRAGLAAPTPEQRADYLTRSFQQVAELNRWTEDELVRGLALVAHA